MVIEGYLYIKKVINIAVLASKRYIAKTEFLKNLTILQKNILQWCVRQPPKYQSFGITELYDYIQNARKYACIGNSIYVKSVNTDEDKELLNKRIEYFKQSKSFLTMLNYHLPVMLEVYNLSIKKAYNWSNLILKTSSQIEGVIKSDKKKLK